MAPLFLGRLGAPDIRRRWAFLALGDFFELQAELHRRIEEAVDRLERHAEPFRNAAERQADLEAALGHLQIPELMLQDDGHLVRDIARAAGPTAARLGVGVERNVEMMIARQALLGDSVSTLRTTPRSACWVRRS